MKGHMLGLNLGANLLLVILSLKLLEFMNYSKISNFYSYLPVFRL